MINQERSVPPFDPNSAAPANDIRQRASAVIATTRNDWASHRTVDEPVLKRAGSRAGRAYWRWQQGYAALEDGLSRRGASWQFAA